STGLSSHAKSHPTLLPSDRGRAPTSCLAHSFGAVPSAATPVCGPGIRICCHETKLNFQSFPEQILTIGEPESHKASPYSDPSGQQPRIGHHEKHGCPPCCPNQATW